MTESSTPRPASPWAKGAQSEAKSLAFVEPVAQHAIAFSNGLQKIYQSHKIGSDSKRIEAFAKATLLNIVHFGETTAFQQLYTLVSFLNDPRAARQRASSQESENSGSFLQMVRGARGKINFAELDEELGTLLAGGKSDFQSLALQLSSQKPPKVSKNPLSLREKYELCEEIVQQASVVAAILLHPDLSKPYLVPFAVADELQIKGCGIAALEELKTHLEELKKFGAPDRSNQRFNRPPSPSPWKKDPA